MGPLDIRCFATVATIPILIKYGETIHPDALVLLTLVSMLLAYFIIICFRKNEWSAWLYVLATAFFVAAAWFLTVRVGSDGGDNTFIVWPLVWILA
jgi:4-amino-4-deoxy-L-arabinose transferase-like glycosyltransferase